MAGMKTHLAACLTVGLLLAAYFGVYLATVESKLSYDRHGDLVMIASYKFREPVAKWLFWPAHQLDRRVRTKEWEIAPVHNDPLSGWRPQRP
jgi:hypothetical protein